MPPPRSVASERFKEESSRSFQSKRFRVTSRIPKKESVLWTFFS